MRNHNKNSGGRSVNKPDNIPSRMYQEDNEQRNKLSGGSDFAQESSPLKMNQEHGSWQQTRLDHRRSTDPSRQPILGSPIAEEAEMDDALNRSWEDDD
ncbi:MAG TPA: hypothetical protein VD884_07810 [Ohtaekwangia sp.]|nr:hypothetical protein [Ohtaekwangia sp.]